ncbi:hypothetical protein C9374_010118 [Naegleria lovaniensis]|uniref:HIT-type domain-containing protein n=1 Tax=Naegleria lovaniensis TaxID=51637 RepID=A0AA88GH02_NAELO|nr:uncharacterized protein C9374_010118 [Naegleria lovaniensis]KAG2375114.1 hypothetical protein C9374_010118 [Naegleria lovaniensis]
MQIHDNSTLFVHEHDDDEHKEETFGNDTTTLSEPQHENHVDENNVLEQNSKKRKLSNETIMTDNENTINETFNLPKEDDNTDDDDESSTNTRKILPPCQICSTLESKYTCPGCSIKYCSMECFKNHKTTSKCTGKRDTTKYIDLKEFNDRHLKSDYNFLENLQSQTFHWSRQRDLEKIDSHTYQYHHPKVRELQYRATQKGIRMELMPQGMSKREQNTSYYNKKLDKIFWRLEFIFVNELDHQTGEPCHVVEAHLSEDLKICDCMSRYFDKNMNGSAKTRDQMQKYTSYFEKFKQSSSSSSTSQDSSFGLENSKPTAAEEQQQITSNPNNQCNQERDSPLRDDAFFYFIKVEGRPSSETLYYALDSTLCLRECLKELVILEYPVIEVVLPGYESKYTVITREQMNDMNAQRDERLKEKKEKRQAFLEKKTKYEERQAEKLESTFRGQGNKRGGSMHGRGRGGYSGGEKRSHTEASNARGDNSSQRSNNSRASNNRTEERRGGFTRGGKSKNYNQHRPSQNRTKTQSSEGAQPNNN